MTENVSPNPMRRKQVQTRLLFGNNRLGIDSTKPLIPSKSKRMASKKLKLGHSVNDSPFVTRPQCPTIDLTEEPEAQVDPRLLEGDHQQSDQTNKIDIESERRSSTDSSEIVELVAGSSTQNDSIVGLDDSYVTELKHDCQENNLTVVAIMTIGELQDECQTLGLTLNSELPEDYSEDSSDESPGGVSYEVESIYDSKKENNVTFYLVKWKNYCQEDNTWEPLANLSNCRKLVEEFKLIRRTDDKNKELVYHNWYRLKGIIEDLVEKKVAADVATAVLIIFNNVRLIEFHYTKVSVRQMRIALREKLNDMDAINNLKQVDKRLQTMETTLNDLIAQLNILKRFPTITEFFDFFDKRKALERCLTNWQNRINRIILDQKEGLPIRIENFVDCELPPDDFEYIAHCKTEDPDIVIDNDPPVYCECTNCEVDFKECCGRHYSDDTQTIAYTKNGILKDSRRKNSPIYECNKKCQCSDDCINRLVQKGRKHKLVVFRTDDGRGWGVRTLEYIAKGSYVMEYVGEIITVEEANRRGAKYDAEGRTYLFDLDFTPDDDTDNEQYQFTLDATQSGNVSHFVNHSCDPNLDTKVVWIENLNIYMPHIALFAVKNIKVNEELTFDYKINVHIEQNPPTEPTADHNQNQSSADMSSESGRATRVQCRCGSDICRKYLY